MQDIADDCLSLSHSIYSCVNMSFGAPHRGHLKSSAVMAEDIMGALLEEKKRREREKQSQEPALNPLRVQTDESQHTDSCQADAGAKI